MGLILKRNFCFDANGRFGTTWMVTVTFKLKVLSHDITAPWLDLEQVRQRLTKHDICSNTPCGPVKSMLVTLHFVITTVKLFAYAQVHNWIRDGDTDGKGDGNNNSSVNRERSMSESDGYAVFAKLYQKSGGEKRSSLFSL